MSHNSLPTLALAVALAAPWVGCASSPPPASEASLRTTIVHVDGMT